jgi:hypothetical protein
VRSSRVAPWSARANRVEGLDRDSRIEEFTDFACVMPLTTIAALEFETALASLVPIQERLMPVPLIGHGVLQAFGMRGGLKVRDRSGQDITARARLEAPAGRRSSIVG